MKPTINTGPRDWRRTVTWKGVAAADNAAIEAYDPIFSLVCASVQVVGAGTVLLQGSNDGVTYATLKDSEGNAMSLVGPAMVEFSSGVRHIKPSVTGGPVDVIVTHWAG